MPGPRLAYQLDLTQREGWRKWVGRHNFAAYLEFRENTFAQNGNGVRYRDQIVSAEAWHTAANLANIPGSGVENRAYMRYYSGGAINQPGSVIDYAGSAPTSFSGAQTFRYYNGVTAQWVNESVNLDEIYFALGMQKSQIRTRGLVWQGFMWKDRIVPTLGWRRDKSRSVNNVAVPSARGRLSQYGLPRHLPDDMDPDAGAHQYQGHCRSAVLRLECH
jgi:hypothetical protein